MKQKNAEFISLTGCNNFFFFGYFIDNISQMRLILISIETINLSEFRNNCKFELRHCTFDTLVVNNTRTLSLNNCDKLNKNENICTVKANTIINLSIVKSYASLKFEVKNKVKKANVKKQMLKSKC